MITGLLRKPAQVKAVDFIYGFNIMPNGLDSKSVIGRSGGTGRRARFRV